MMFNNDVFSSLNKEEMIKESIKEVFIRRLGREVYNTLVRHLKAERGLENVPYIDIFDKELSEGVDASDYINLVGGVKEDWIIGLFMMHDNGFNIAGSPVEKMALSPISKVTKYIADLESGYEGARNSAIQALGKIGDSRAVEPLIEALKDEYRFVRDSAIQALGKIGDSRAVEPLIEALEDEDVDGYVHYFVTQALGEIGDIRKSKSGDTILNSQDGSVSGTSVDSEEIRKKVSVPFYV
ncbi:MAG TPA: HEAT repeat domain-containing protein, partial [Candidatus Omnitrophica bacterium]|nr:HEAT repeat domain-containing protein [Candidatus Omnitrophota bacterium]